MKQRLDFHRGDETLCEMGMDIFFDNALTKRYKKDYMYSTYHPPPAK